MTSDVLVMSTNGIYPDTGEWQTGVDKVAGYPPVRLIDGNIVNYEAATEIRTDCNERFLNG